MNTGNAMNDPHQEAGGPLYQHLEASIALLHRYYRQYQTFLRRQFDISPAEMDLIAYLARQGGSKMRVVCGHFGYKLSTFTSMVDRAEADGIVVRVASPMDRRVTLLMLTERGNTIYREYSEHIRGAARLLHAQWEVQPMHHFFKGLEALSDHLQQL